MNEDNIAKDFTIKFSELTENNQRYIVAIQQALVFAQTSNEPEEERVQYGHGDTE